MLTSSIIIEETTMAASSSSEESSEDEDYSDKHIEFIINPEVDAILERDENAPQAPRRENIVGVPYLVTEGIGRSKCCKKSTSEARRRRHEVPSLNSWGGWGAL